MADENRQKYIKDIREYVSAEYNKILNIKNIKDDVMRQYLEKADVTTWSHRNRITRNIQILKHTFLIHKTNVITTCFKISLDSTSCIYAYLHSQYMPNIKCPFDYRFVCTGPTFRSQDGEYRGRVIPWDNVNQLFTKYADTFEHIEQVIIDKINSAELTFQVDFYYPAIFQHARDFESSINNLRLPVKLLILCWIYDIYNIQHHIIENHVNPAYQYIITQLNNNNIFGKIVDKIGIEEYKDMMQRIACTYNDINDPDQNIVEVRCGQKIFPLSALEAVRTDDINFNVWREIYITNMMSNLVLNIISPSFPFINNWFYIQHTHSGLFDNIAMHEKYNHSEIAADISTQLKNIDKFNYINNDTTKGPVSNKFYRLSKHIHKSIIYADSDIKLTDLAVCMTSEYVGRTLRDIPTLIVNKEDIYGLNIAFTDHGMFTKHMFEFIYAFYCMNIKSGVMHGDLHMNNVTLAELYNMVNRQGKKYINNPHIVYIVDQTPYIFAHFGLFSTIIDFSRAVIGDYKKLEHEFSPRFAEMYFKEQRIRVMHIIYHYFPKLMNKYHDKIEALLISNFPLMFKIITAIDTFVVMTNINAMFSIDDAFTYGKIKIAAGVTQLLTQLKETAEHIIVTNIHAAIEGNITSPDDIEWPNLTIIKKHFSSNILVPDKMSNTIAIIEIFNSMNDLIYDIEDYDTWGPLLSLDKQIELRKKYKQPITDGIKNWLAYKQYDETMLVEALTTKYEHQEEDILQFESWMIT